MAKAKDKMIRIKQVKSGIGSPADQKATLRALGISRMHQTVERPDNEAVRGMVFKVKHLVEVEEA